MFKGTSRFSVRGLELRVSGLGLRIEHVQGSGLRISGLKAQRPKQLESLDGVSNAKKGGTF